jgi:hypothetical protein
MDEELLNQDPAEEVLESPTQVLSPEDGEEELSGQDSSTEEAEEDPQSFGGESKKSHISVVEAAIALITCSGVDFMELTLSFTGISLLLSIIDIFLWFLWTFLFALKGGSFDSRLKKIAIWTVGNLLEFILILEMLPIRSVIMIWVIWSWNKEVDLEAGLERKSGRMDYWEKKAAAFVEKRFG